MRNPKATLIYRWFQEVWNESREELIDELMTKDATTHGIVAEGGHVSTTGAGTDI